MSYMMQGLNHSSRSHSRKFHYGVILAGQLSRINKRQADIFNHYSSRSLEESKS